MKKSSILLLTILVNVTSYANSSWKEDWKKVGSFNGFSYYVNSNSVKPVGLVVNGLTGKIKTKGMQPEFVIAEMKVEYLEGYSIRDEFNVVEAREKWYFYCPTEEYFNSSYTWYDKEGGVVNSWKSPRAPTRLDFKTSYSGMMVNIMTKSICQKAETGNGFYLSGETYTIQEVLTNALSNGSTFESLAEESGYSIEEIKKMLGH